MRVVADTNTILSAMLWGGLPAEVLVAARDGHAGLFTSAALLAELESVLSREKFATRIVRVGSTVSELVRGYRVLAQPVRVAEIAPACRDPDDDHVLACGLAAHASLIVTGDQDLLSLGTYEGIRIVAAREALEAIRQGRSSG